MNSIAERYTIEEVSNLLRSCGLTLIKYGGHKNIECIDGDGYRYKTTTSYLSRNSDKPNLLRGNPFAKYNIFRFVELHNPSIELLDFEYVNTNTPNIPFICKYHKDNGIQVRSSYDLLHGKGCKHCARSKAQDWKRISKESAIKRCNELSVDFVALYTKNEGTWIKYRCPHHLDKGEIDVPFYRFAKQSKACRYCAGKQRTFEDLKAVVSIKNENIIVFPGEYLNEKSRFDCQCTVCGWKWNTTAHNLSVNTKCPKCGRIKASKSRITTQDEFILKLQEAQPNIIPISEYISCKTAMRFKCKIDGCEWESIPSNILNCSASCPSCRSNSNENIVRNILLDLGFRVDSQYRFNGCKDKYTLPFDMFLPEHNVLVEYDGEQHYFPVPFRGNAFDAQISFEKTKLHDKIKDDFCVQNNIPLIRIPYWEKDNLKEYIVKKLSDVGVPLPASLYLSGAVTTAG